MTRAKTLVTICQIEWSRSLEYAVCCMDYNKKHNFGNLLEQDYFEIFKGKGYTDLITKNMNALGENNNSICRQCERAVKANG